MGGRRGNSYPAFQTFITGIDTPVAEGGTAVSYTQLDVYKRQIHNYFCAKSLDQVRPGGVVAFVTSRYTMDAKDSTVRRYLAPVSYTHLPFC